MTILSLVFLTTQYLMQLQQSVLVIEKYMVAKQQVQLSDFLKSQKNAIIMYKVFGASAKPEN
jgi:hypothetical protein